MSLIYGIGINDSDHPVKVRVNGERIWCPYYRRWSQMMARCYSPATLKNQKTYERVSVCKDWIRFSNFEKWMKEQDWAGQHLDKDILGDGLIYSPENCAFVSRAANNLIAWRCQPGEYHKRTGVYKISSGDSFYFLANGCGRKKEDRFYSEMEARMAWFEVKINRAKEIAKKEKDSRIRSFYVEKVKSVLLPHIVG